MPIATIIAAIASFIVAGYRSKIISRTGRSVRNELPRSPCSKPIQ
jgi:hypothetical protein